MVLLLTGCTVTHVSNVSGSWSVVRKSVFTRQNIGELQIVQGTNGITVRVRGYSNDQVDAVGVAVEAAVSAAVKGVKP